uniref:Epigen n=1 Tax=Pogona vitticeps TaxID=103695 RepID=A0ABM5GMV8_9SAUR
MPSFVIHFFLPAGHTVSPMDLKSIQSCFEEHNDYCLNGICVFHTELKMPNCRCFVGYSGERCEHLMLNSYTQYSSECYVAVGIGGGMLLIGMIAVIYCYIRKRYKETKASYKVCHGEAAV